MNLGFKRKSIFCQISTQNRSHAINQAQTKTKMPFSIYAMLSTINGNYRKQRTTNVMYECCVFLSSFIEKNMEIM